VSGNFFQVLGVPAFAGRVLTPQDDTIRGGNNVAVLGYSYWEKHFGDVNTVGRKVLVNGHPIEIIGVAPSDFRGVLSGQTPDLYIPISMTRVMSPGFGGFDNPNWHWLTIVGRLRPGVLRSRAQAALNPIFTSIVRDELGTMQIKSAHSRDRVLSVRLEAHPAAAGLNSLERTWRKPLMVLLFAAGGLLLIACSNLASLLLVRAAGRIREIAIRRSVGATRMKVISQLLAESILLALLGGALGILLALGLTRGILQILPPDVTGGWVGSNFSWQILAFTLSVSVMSGVVFGLLPAWQVSGDSAAAALKEQGRQVASGSSHTRWRRGLVVVQIALSVVLLACAGLFMKSLIKLLNHNPGFHTENLVNLTIEPGLRGYTTVQALNLYEQVREKLSQLPGVTAVSFCEFGPYSNSESSTNVSVEGYHPSEDEDMDSRVNRVAADFFHTLGIPVVTGREFAVADGPNRQKTAVVNETFVRRFLRGREPIGTHMSVGAGKALDLQIVGVVRNAQLDGLREESRPFYYLPIAQFERPNDPARRGVFLIRTRTEDAALPSGARRIVRSLDGALPVTNMERMQVQIRNSVYQDRAVAVLTSASGLLALLLASLGLYGVIAYAVSRRTAEIGIRMALGADRRSIMSLVLREVVWMVAGGAGIGVIAGLVLTRAIASQLFGVQSMDAAIFTSAVAVLFVISLLAGAGPTVRAARVDPMQALRYD
jgi:predicted permease